MAAALARTASYQLLDTFTGRPGVIADAAALAYRIDDISTPAKLATPVQVYPVPTVPPAAPATRQAVDLVADRVSLGRYVARWTLPTTTAVTRYRITWFCTPAVDAAEVSWCEEFDVVAGPASWGWCLPSDLRGEGVSATEASDLRLATTITLASRMIERYTGNWFEPLPLALNLDGRGRNALLLQHPIISVSDVALTTYMDAVPILFELDDCRVYNRHLTDGLTSPDDRQNPKLELLRYGSWFSGYEYPNYPNSLMPLRWPRGTQNVKVTGVYGYTDRDGDAPAGKLPDLLRHACKLMCLRELPVMTDVDEREDRRDRWRVTSDRTRDQAQTRASAGRTGRFTGSPEIDSILEIYERPPMHGAA